MKSVEGLGNIFNSISSERRLLSDNNIFGELKLIWYTPFPYVATTSKLSEDLKLKSSTIVDPNSSKPICCQTVFTPSKFLVPIIQQ